MCTLQRTKRCRGLAQFEQDDPEVIGGVCLFGIQSDRLLELCASELQFFLLQVGESQIVMGRVGTRIQLKRLLVVLDGFRNLAALKLRQPQ